MRKKGVSCRLSSYLNRKSQKQAPTPNRPRSDDDRGPTAPPKLPELSPKQENVTIYKTREQIRKDSARDRENIKNTRRDFSKLTTRKRKKDGWNSSFWA